MTAFLQVIPTSPIELTMRRKRLLGQRRLLNVLIAIKGIELQYERMKNDGKANEKTFEIGQEIVILRAKLGEYEDGIAILNDIISWLKREELSVPERLAS